LGFLDFLTVKNLLDLFDCQKSAKGYNMTIINQMTRGQLLRQKQSLDEEIARIKAQLELADLNRREFGEMADPDWYRRAKYALRIKGIRVQAIQTELAERKGEHRISLETRFIEVARDELDKEVFENIMEQARMMAEEGKK